MTEQTNTAGTPAGAAGDTAAQTNAARLRELNETIRYTMINGRLFDARTMNEIGNRERPRGKFYWEK